MKVAPTADYPVQVIRQEWEESGETARLYAGIFAVTLNHHVDIAFIPDLSAVAPPWDDHLLPDDLDAIETAEQARIATALLSPYIVTPHPGLAGGEEVFQWPPDEPEGAQVVFYVTREEFDSYAADLDGLTTVASRSAEPRVSQLRDHPVVGFLEQRVVASLRLNPQDAILLGQHR